MDENNHFDFDSHNKGSERQRGEAGGEVVDTLGVCDVSSSVNCHGWELRVRDVSSVVKCLGCELKVGHACSGTDFFSCNPKYQKEH
jgi:hypothetical protein